MSPAAAEYAEDDVYDEEQYDPEDYDELSPEDQEAMDKATKEVCSALGVDVRKVTLEQVHDALWHYYFDVEKSLAYLKKTVVAPKSAPPKATPKATPKAPVKKTAEGTSHSKFPSCLPAGASYQTNHGSARQFPSLPRNSFPILEKPRLPPRFYFDDMPWFHIPRTHDTVFKAPLLPRGGLLGGGEGGMTKLQKLAAARKKKMEEAKEKENVSDAQSGISKITLSEKEPSKGRPTPILPSAKRQKIAEAGNLSSRPVVSQEMATHDGDLRQGQPGSTTAIPGEAPDNAEDHDEVVSMPKARPSEFARALFGDKKKAPAQENYPVPYTLHPSYDASIFSKPSPDDVVFTAQSQGSNFVKTK